jgi:hypothetical protein
MIVPTRDAEGNPVCFICGQSVAKAGEACSRECYTHFVVAVVQQGGPVEMESLVDLDDQPWNTDNDG